MSSSSSSSSSTTLGGLPSMNAASLHQYLPQPKPARSFGDRVSFETGVSYFAGLVGGGSFGLFAGVREARRQQFTGKLFMNQVVNFTGKSGGSTANTFGVFALTYSLSRDAMRYWVRKDVDDSRNELFGVVTAASMQSMLRFGLRWQTVIPVGVAVFALGTFSDESATNATGLHKL